jgi:hypothetical protein
MASSVGNTSSLSSGARITKRQFNDYTATAISGMIARANYESLTLSDSKINELRKYVYKMVSGWGMQDKLRIISEYGDYGLLGGGMNEAKVNKQLTETLIINMKQEDLEILLKDIKNSERDITKDVRDVNNNRKRLAKNFSKTQFSVKTFESIYDKIKDSKSPRKLQSLLKKFEKSYKVPKFVTKKFGQLKKEVEDVLKNLFDKVQLNNLAIAMNIEIDESMDIKKITTLISNKVQLYVDLLVGKSKKGYAGAIISREPFDEILQYTSFAFLTGRVSLTPEKIDEMRLAARIAKAQMTEGFRNMKRKTFFKPKAEKKAEKNIKNKEGSYNKFNEYLVEMKIIDEEGNIIDFQKLVDLAAKNGIEYKKGKKPEKVLEELRVQIEKKNLALTSLQSSKDKLEKRGKILSTENRGKYEALKKELQIDYDMGDGVEFKGKQELIPVIEFSTTGDINWGGKNRAVPVYVINGFIDQRKKIEKEVQNKLKGSIEAVKEKYDTKTIEEQIVKKGRELNEAYAKYGSSDPKKSITIEEIEKIQKEYDVLKAKLKNLETKESIEQNKKDIEEIEAKKLKLRQELFNADNMAGGGLSYGGGGGVAFKNQNPLDFIKSKNYGIDYTEYSNGLNDADASDPTKNPLAELYKEAKKNFMELQTASSDGLKNKNDGFTAFKKYKYESTKGNRGIFNDLDETNPFIAEFSGDKGTQAFDSEGTMGIRVMDMSKVITPTARAKSAISFEADSIGINGVQRGPASPVYIVNKNLDVTTRTDKLAEDSIKQSAKLLLSSMGLGAIAPLVGLSTGGTGRSLGTTKNSFIAGDSKTGRENKELVNIDWKSKSFSVKPIPEFADGGSQKNISGQIKRMTSEERNKPMSVGISSHSVTYTRALSGISNEGTKEAIKVYSVNPGITDVVEVGGINVSLIGLVADMTQRLTNIEGLLSIGNQQRSANVAATTEVAKGISKLKGGSNGGGNPFVNGGFPSSLDSILQGS